MYRKSLELEPGSSTAHYNLAAALTGTGELAEAEKHLRAAIELEATAPAYAALARVLTELGRTDEARQALASAQALEPASTTVQ
jgi:Flp pilus assembly protein TadD